MHRPCAAEDADVAGENIGQRRQSRELGANRCACWWICAETAHGGMIRIVRVVIDTNVLVSARLSRSGASNLLVRLWLRGRVDAAVTPALFLEYEEVLKRPDLFPAGDIAHVDRLLDRLARVSRLVTNLPSARPRLSDPDDEMVLDAALDSGAGAIVTFNKADFRPIGPKLGLSLLAPGEFLRILR